MTILILVIKLIWINILSILDYFCSSEFAGTTINIINDTEDNTELKLVSTGIRRSFHYKNKIKKLNYRQVINAKDKYK